MPFNLATLANVKDWLGITNTASDATLTRLIAAASRFILSDINRQDLSYHQVTETRDGTGTPTLVLQEYPVISVISLTVQGIPIPASTGYPANGYVFDPWSGQDTSSIQRLSLAGTPGWLGPFGWYGGRLCFPRCPGGIEVVYMAGYYISDESWTVPSAAPYQVTPYRLFGEDEGVAYANGTPLTLAPNAGNLTQGQYYPDPLTGLYNFSSADVGAELLGSYSYIPEDLAQACCELVGERYRAKARIGIVTQTLGGQETTTYSQRDMNQFIESLIAPYRKTIPL